jgi:hypothetical protein
MATGIHLENCANAVITGGKHTNLDVGISLKDSDVTLDGTEFKNVSTAVKGVGKTPIDAKNVTHTDLHWDSNATPLDVVRRFANAYV